MGLMIQTWQYFRRNVDLKTLTLSWINYGGKHSNARVSINPRFIMVLVMFHYLKPKEHGLSLSHTVLTYLRTKTKGELHIYRPHFLINKSGLTCKPRPNTETKGGFCEWKRALNHRVKLANILDRWLKYFKQVRLYSWKDCWNPALIPNQ